MLKEEIALFRRTLAAAASSSPSCESTSSGSTDYFGTERRFSGPLQEACQHAVPSELAEHSLSLPQDLLIMCNNDCNLGFSENELNSQYHLISLVPETGCSQLELGQTALDIGSYGHVLENTSNPATNDCLMPSGGAHSPDSRSSFCHLDWPVESTSVKQNQRTGSDERCSEVSMLGLVGGRHAHTLGWHVTWSHAYQHEVDAAGVQTDACGFSPMCESPHPYASLGWTCSSNP